MTCEQRVRLEHAAPNQTGASARDSCDELARLAESESHELEGIESPGVADGRGLSEGRSGL